MVKGIHDTHVSLRVEGVAKFLALHGEWTRDPTRAYQPGKRYMRLPLEGLDTPGETPLAPLLTALSKLLPSLDIDSTGEGSQMHLVLFASPEDLRRVRGSLIQPSR